MRYGSIRYVNNLPVDHALVTGRVPGPRGLAVTSGTPAELNTAMRDGHVDVSAVSAAMLLEPGLDLRILPEACIASHGPVDSVLLVSKRPFEDLDARPVAVSDQSATGALLLRILLERDVGVRPTYRVHASDLDRMLADHDAALLIGDDALRASAQPDAFRGLHVLDLGEAWRAYSGLPMVYAVWVARGASADSDPEGLTALRRALRASRDWGLAHMDTILDEAHHRTQVPDVVLRTYFERLTHSLGPREAEGLRRFIAEATALAKSGQSAMPPVLEGVA